MTKGRTFLRRKIEYIYINIQIIKYTFDKLTDIRMFFFFFTDSNKVFYCIVEHISAVLQIMEIKGVQINLL